MSERKQPWMFVDADVDPRAAYAGASAGEIETVLSYLGSYRHTIELKCQGLDAQQLATRSIPPSTMSLLGLIRHLARVEHHWARRVLEGRQDIDMIIWSADRADVDFDDATADPQLVQEAWDTWRAEVAHAQEVIAGRTDWSERVGVHGDQVEIRDVMVHLVEEYARHAGHADLLREAIDGRTGQ